MSPDPKPRSAAERVQTLHADPRCLTANTKLINHGYGSNGLAFSLRVKLRGARTHPPGACGVRLPVEAVVGTAGWGIGRADAAAFPEAGTALERYSRVFGGVEVNSSFYRSHRASTWARWAASVPEHFRFAVKLPKAITHQAKLVDVDSPVKMFGEEVAPLGGKLAVVLVQLPPKLGFEPQVAERFFECLQRSVQAVIVCEPRNAAWFDDAADALLRSLRVARVAADPALCSAAAVPGGWLGAAYWRLHGSPSMYRSPYAADAIDRYARQMRDLAAEGITPWCMFDNTAASAATGDALALMARLRREP